MKKISMPILVAVFGAGLLINPVPAHAQIYDTFGPGDTFDTNDFVSFTQGGGLDEYADRFTSPATENVSLVQIALEGVTADASITLSIHSNSGNEPAGPTGIIGTFAPVTLPSDPAVVTFEATTDFELEANTEYWLTASASNGQIEWFYNDQGIQNFTSAHIGGSWNTEDVPGMALAFEINQVPEPESLPLCATGLGVWLLGRYLRRPR